MRRMLAAIGVSAWGLLAGIAADAQVAAGGHADGLVLANFDRPPLFAFTDFEKSIRVEEGLLRLSAPTNKGGFGINFPSTRDLSASTDRCPVLVLTIHPASRARTIRVRLASGDTNAAWTYRLEGRQPGRELRVEPVDGATLDSPQEREGIFDLARVGQLQVQGDWGADPIDVTLRRLELAPPSAGARSEQAAARRKRQEADAAARLAKQEARRAIRHAADGPRVVHVGAVAAEILGVTLIEGTSRRNGYVPYVEQPGDRIVGEGKVAAWVDGRVVLDAPEKRTLRRIVDGQEREIGYLVGGRGPDAPRSLWPFEERTGADLQKLTAGDPESYRIVSPDDPAYAAGKIPRAVHRKTKPLDRVFPSGGQILRHTIYLVLPAPLVEGRTYTIEFPGLNASEPAVRYVHDTRTATSEAIHAQQAGYRPDDPFKRAFLSIWLGSGGAYTHRGVSDFELIDGSGRVAFTGKAERTLAADGKESMPGVRNHSGTAVWALDFSRFAAPGTYRVRVPGIGTSEPFPIAPDVWEGAFKKSMHGFLAQRSGIALGPPFTTFVRPRDMHPADGWKVFRSRTSYEEAYRGGGDWFAGLLKGRTEELRPEAWGGYHDAGDFDRASGHLWASYLHLELLDLFPEYFRNLGLALPPAEATDRIPDVINEALWNLDCFRRLQDPDGGVSGGIEASSHPRAGEASFLESLVLMTYAPDANSSFTFAAVAAKAARLLKPFETRLSATYAEAAARAWAWAESHRSRIEGERSAEDDAKNTAAAELLWLTGQELYESAFRATTRVDRDGWLIEQQNGAFTYARLPNGVGDPALKARIKHKLLRQADAAIAYGDGNVFGLTTEIPGLPLIGPVGAFTTPGMISRVLPRAHFLSGDRKYLAAAVRATNFPLGANPDNQTMTTGVGRRAPRAPLHFDSRFSGQEAPAGLTMYGAYDAESLPSFARANDWVHTYYVGSTMIPKSKTWPPAEGYVDFFLWPMMNEFTIAQNLGPTSYWWGYLAACRGMNEPKSN
ncbi:glycoside hydrolase family 9 protein [Aquisphaera insulae]|uniref:glycoside hydrolase family 9 protein n=1 Tax=Aquisphaera insulae TaxID=2712864 RepID=UPI0013ED662E|nr:glycoside hydrolase family 9 protein [Aquisphaera insulae]